MSLVLCPLVRFPTDMSEKVKCHGIEQRKSYLGISWSIKDFFKVGQVNKSISVSIEIKKHRVDNVREFIVRRSFLLSGSEGASVQLRSKRRTIGIQCKLSLEDVRPSSSKLSM